MNSRWYQGNAWQDCCLHLDAGVILRVSSSRSFNQDKEKQSEFRTELDFAAQLMTRLGAGVTGAVMATLPGESTKS
jgi:hypothetical protein